MARNLQLGGLFQRSAAAGSHCGSGGFVYGQQRLEILHFFFEKIFRPILIKTSALKTWHRN